MESSLAPTLLVAGDASETAQPEVATNALLAAAAEPRDALLDELMAGDFSEVVVPPRSVSSRYSAAAPGAEVGSRSLATYDGISGAHDLFGEHFHAVRDGDDIVDPEYLDAHTIMERAFGSYYGEAGDIDASAGSAEALRQLVLEARGEDARLDLVEVFGPDINLKAHKAHDLLREDASFGILKSTLPQSSPALRRCKTLWLVELAKVDPNRQILHADPLPYRPSQVTQPLVSTERRLFTSQNVMRWAYIKERQQYVSNARLVRWSDESYTLHVGRDMYELAVSTQNSLSALAAQNTVHKCGTSLSALTAVQGYDERMIARTADAASIKEALVAENQKHRATEVQNRVGIPFGAPLPKIDMKKHGKERTAVEEWVMKERDKRRKEILARAQAGRPMMIAEQLEAEQQMMEKIRTAAIEDLRLEQEAEARESALRSGTGGRSRRQNLSYDNDAQEGDNWEKIMSDINNGSSTRPRGEDDEEEADLLMPTRKSHRPESTATSFDERHHLLEALAAQLPQGSESAALVQSVMAMLKKSSTQPMSEDAFHRELQQIADDIRQESGVDISDVDLEPLRRLGVKC